VIRLLIVLAVVIFAAVFMNYHTHRGPAKNPDSGVVIEPDAGGDTSPQALYRQNTGQAKALEQQMQQQAQSQLDAIDAGSR